jgi:hypothetical protein
MPDPSPSTPRAAAVEFVTVACKLPNGIHLDVFDQFEYEENTIMGTRKSKRAVRSGRVTIAGIKRRTDDSRLVMGFALTPNVPRDHWEAWLAANKDTPLVVNGLIFAHRQHSSVQDMAKEREANRSGLEPLDPRNLPKEFRGKVETATSAA